MTRKKRHHKKTSHKRTHHRRVSGRKTTRRRRRVGAHSKLTDAVLLGVGAVAGGVVTPFIVQAITSAMGSGAASVPAWMIPAGGAATGVVVAAMAKGNHLLTGFGAGMAGIAGAMAANEIGLSEPGISGSAFSNNQAPGAAAVYRSVGGAFSNNAAPGSNAVTRTVGCRGGVGTRGFVNQGVGNVSRMEAQAIGALYSN